MPAVQGRNRTPALEGRKKFRRGLLFMWLAAVVGYFSGGYSMPVWVPVQVPPIVFSYLAPLLFLGGLGLSTYGYYLQHRRV